MFADHSGHAPWRTEVFPVAFPDTGNPIYESEEDAAFAAGISVRTLTNSNDHEYICGIYKLDCGGYTVGAPFKGEHASADPNDVLGEYSGYSDRTLVAMVHSHPYCNGHVPNDFSMVDSNNQPIGDFAVALQLRIPIYLAAPNGNLMKLHVFNIYPTDDGLFSVEYFTGTVRSGLPGDNSMFNCRK